MENHELNTEEGALRLSFCSGRIDLWSGSARLTGPRGGSALLRLADCWGSSETADWSVQETSPDGIRARGELRPVPGALEWELRRKGDGFETELRWLLPEEVCLQEVGFSLELDPAYPGWADRRGRRILPHPEEQEKLAWCGFPEGAYLAAVAPGTDRPDLRLSLDDRCRMKEARILAPARSGGGQRWEWICLAGDRRSIRLEPGEHSLIQGWIGLRAQPPEPLQYPRNAIRDDGLGRVVLVSGTDPDHARAVRGMFSEGWPKVLRDGRPEPPEVLGPEEIPSGPLGWFRLRRRRPRTAIALVRTVERLEEGFGLRANGMALAMGAGFRMKVDRVGCSQAHPVGISAYAIRLGHKIRWTVRRWSLRLVKAGVLGLTLLAYPALGAWILVRGGRS